MRNRERVVLRLFLVALALSPHYLLAQDSSRWEVTLALRVGAAQESFSEVKVALPADDEWQSLHNLKIKGRGLDAFKMPSAVPEVVFRGRLDDARRLSLNYEVVINSVAGKLPDISSAEAATTETLLYMEPAPLFPSRSILVREFLETHVSPMIRVSGRGKLNAAKPPLLRAIFKATREELKHQSDGKSLVLDSLRRRTAKRIGIERSFTTFLRCAGIPARFVEGIDLRSKSRRKRVFWNEVWHGDRWWPISASRGWIGERPSSYIALTRDGRRVVTAGGQIEVSYVVHTRRIVE